MGSGGARPRVIGKKGGVPAFRVGALLTLGLGLDIAANDSNTQVELPVGENSKQARARSVAFNRPRTVNV